MIYNIMANVPDYVRKTIYYQTGRLLKTGHFADADKDDIIQDLLLFYYEKLKDKDGELPEAVVVTALKNFSSNLLRLRIRRRFFLSSSLSDADAEVKFDLQDKRNIWEQIDQNMTLEKMLTVLNSNEQKIISLLFSGLTMVEISQKYKVSRNFMMRIIKKIQKKLK